MRTVHVPATTQIHLITPPVRYAPHGAVVVLPYYVAMEDRLRPFSLQYRYIKLSESSFPNFMQFSESTEYRWNPYQILVR